jgi:protein SCO1
MRTPTEEFQDRPHRRVWPVFLLGGLLISGAFAAVVYASLQEEDPRRVAPGDLPTDVGLEQKLDAQVPLDIRLRDESGKTVELRDLLNGKPAILTLVYFECPMLCHMTRDGQLRSLSELSLSAGEDFTALTVSFDPRETPKLARAAKQTALKRYDRPGAEAGWRFLTGEEEQLRRLTEAVGFRYKFDQKTGQYAHPAGLIVLTPEGKVSRYLYGVDFPQRDLRLALIEASGGQIGSPTDQVLLLCYHYDPTTGKYGLAIINVLRLAGFATVLAMVMGFTVLMRRERENDNSGYEPSET